MIPVLLVTGGCAGSDRLSAEAATTWRYAGVGRASNDYRHHALRAHELCGGDLVGIPRRTTLRDVEQAQRLCGAQGQDVGEFLTVQGVDAAGEEGEAEIWNQDLG